MYKIDDRDRVIELDLPQMDPGATCPEVYASDNDLRVSYFLAETEPVPRQITVVFELSSCHYFGWPNDEILRAHPLYKRGLGFYGVFEVLDSSWIRAMAAGNSLHDRHDPARFLQKRHFIFTFHDDTFECIAEGMSFKVSEVKDN